LSIADHRLHRNDHRSQSGVRQIVLNPQHVEPLPATESDAAASSPQQREMQDTRRVTSVIVRTTILPGFSHAHESTTLCRFMIILSPMTALNHVNELR
jgi:hypothetical protein